MKKILLLSKRNCLLFLRNKQVVFSSLLSSLILITLYFLFIGNLYSQGLNNMINLSQNQINASIYLQMIMGVLVINSISLSTGMFTFMARDFETHKTEAFLLTKAKPIEITLSYLISALSVSFALNFLTFLVSVLLIGLITGIFISFVSFISIFLILILTCIIGCAIMLLITSIVKSSVAIGVISGIIGTVLGFLCGIYMPYSNMGEMVVVVGSLLPFTHLTIWLKQVALGDLFSQFGMPKDVSEIVLNEAFSAKNIGLCGLNIPLWGMILISVLVALICFIVSIFLLKNKFKNKNQKLKTKLKR